jgi:hypothetical protein
METSDLLAILFAFFGPILGGLFGHFVVGPWLWGKMQESQKQSAKRLPIKDYGGRVPTAEEWYSDQFTK